MSKRTKRSTVRPIIYVVPAFPNTSETFVAAEVRRLHARGLPIMVLSLDKEANADQGMLKELKACGVCPVYPLDPHYLQLLRNGAAHLLRHPIRSISAARTSLSWPIAENASKISRWLKVLATARIADRCHAQHMHGHWTIPTDVVIGVSRITSLSYSFSAHAHDIYEDAETYTALSRDAGLSRRIGDSTFVATCTAFNLQYLRNRVPAAADKIHLVHHGVDLEIFDGAQDQPTRGCIEILSVGRLVAYKGFDSLLNALAYAIDQGHAVKCTIIGEGSQRRRLETMCAELNLESVVHFTGRQPQVAVRDALRRAGLFMFCGDGSKGQYGLPNVLFEAMAMGVPTICTRLPGIDDLIEDGRTGYVVQHQEELHKRLAQLLIDTQLRKDFGRHARDKIVNNFDANRTFEPLVALLEHANTS